MTRLTISFSVCVCLCFFCFSLMWLHFVLRNKNNGITTKQTTAQAQGAYIYTQWKTDIFSDRCNAQWIFFCSFLAEFRNRLNSSLTYSVRSFHHLGIVSVHFIWMCCVYVANNISSTLYTLHILIYAPKNGMQSEWDRFCSVSFVAFLSLAVVFFLYFNQKNVWCALFAAAFHQYNFCFSFGHFA